MEAGIPCFTIAPLSPVPPPSPAHRPTRATYFNRTTRPYFNSTTAGSGGGNGGSQKWSRNNREWVSSSVDFEEYEFFNKNDDVGGAAKQRIWWSNDSDDDNWDDDFGENEFWGFKTIRAFGWMIPAVTVSYLLGTDNSNAFFMALAVPLGQTVISLIIDKVWASTTNGPKSRSRAKKKKKKPFTEAAGAARRGERREESKTSNGRARSERSEDSKPSTGRASYRSWMARDDGSYKNLNKRTQKFGGWDDLDKDSYKVPRGKPSQNEDLPPKQHNRRKLSRIRRVKEEPLLLRLLIAVFPFLGSWTRILF